MKKVIKIWATFCGPCRIYGPIFDRVKKELESDDLKFISIDIEEGHEVYGDKEELKTRFGIKSIPYTIILDEDDEIVTTKPGMMREAQLKQFIQE